jgi:hypothetical protein
VFVMQKRCLLNAFVVVVSLLAATSFAAEEVMSQASGLRGTTRSMVRSGMPGGPTTGGPASVEFAIVPMQGDRPEYQNAIFVKSDQQGRYEVALPPGRYWLGPRAKALDPTNYRPTSVMFSEEIVVVREGNFSDVDLMEMGYAP